MTKKVLKICKMQHDDKCSFCGTVFENIERVLGEL